MSAPPALFESSRSLDEALRLWACQRASGDSIDNTESERLAGARSAWKKSRAAGAPMLASFSRAASFVALHLKASLAGGPHNTAMLLKGGGSLVGCWVERAAREALARTLRRSMDPARAQRIDLAEDEALSRVQDAFHPRWAAIKKADAWRLAEPELLARKLYDTLVYERMKGWIEFAQGGQGRLKEQIALDVAVLSEQGKARALAQTSPSLDETLTLLELCSSRARWRPRDDLPPLLNLAQSYFRARSRSPHEDGRLDALKARLERAELDASMVGSTKTPPLPRAPQRL